MWWDTQLDSMKDKVRNLVANGQLELINGGWSMHDEACPTYTDMIDNMAKGHAFIAKNFPGYHPRIGWQIDPFGHSNTNMRLFSDMGFDAVFMARMDRHDKEERLKSESMEFVWRPSNDTLGGNV